MGRQITRDEILIRLNNIDEFKNEYEIKENTILGATKKASFKHNNCSFEFEMIIKDFIRGQRCPNCAHEKRRESLRKHENNNSNKEYSLLSEEKIKEYTSKVENKFKSLHVLNYINDKNVPSKHRYVEIFCDDCQEVTKKHLFEILYNNQGCPNCAKKRTGKKNNIDFVKEKFLEHGFELLSDYKSSHSLVELKCLNCQKIQKKSFNTIVNLDGVCECHPNSMSKGERIISDFLIENNINYDFNKNLNNLKDNSQLRFDFILKEKNIIIEFDGEQHFIEKEFFRDDLKTIQKHDRIKDRYCLDQNIEIIRISYKNRKNKIRNVLRTLIIDGKPYDRKLSRTVWFGGKSDINKYIEFNSL